MKRYGRLFCLDIIYIFSFIMIDNQDYLLYLQQKLFKNHVDFLSLEQFEATQKGTKKDIGHQKVKPSNKLSSNIREPLTRDLVERYSRQMLLKQISYEGQVRIVKAKVALIGSGGIGCPLALYLAAAGVGTLGLFDSDSVDVTNLHRQIGHRTDRIGMEKTESLKQTLLAINPHITINKHPFVTVENANILDQYDYVVDGSDNPMCRYTVNDYCMKTGKKLLSGACIGWQAQITCYGGDNLCYRCLWGNDQVSLGGCSSLGVIGMLPGIVGMVLATECLKLIVNKQSSLEGKLLTYDARKCEFKKIALRKKKAECIGCGQEKLQMQTYNYAKYTLCSDGEAPKVNQIQWESYLASSDKFRPTILDVRPESLFNIVHFDSSINIPLDKLKKMSKQQIQDKLVSDSEKNQPIAVSCVRGVTSRHAVYYLSLLGLEAISIAGGIRSYSSRIDDSIPQL